ncbi:adenylyl-sulfate kinase [uncultured Aureimonas sp.]|uniref:adenylyl-sulfate kinase n=1 Tax=uncultured Aureimonas sp. TaxID=1604662 RepID=UPI0025F76D12|nr:adenylyl-sulfate kinase [uncultured Aureimonas sp.]
MAPHDFGAPAPLRLLLCGSAAGTMPDRPFEPAGGQPLAVVDRRGHEDVGALALAAARCDAAVVVVDTDRSVDDALRRMLQVVRLAGLHNVFLAVDGESSPDLREDLTHIARTLDLFAPASIESARDLWSTLGDELSGASAIGPAADAPFRLLVSDAPSPQAVSGIVIAGTVRIADRIASVETGRASQIAAMDVDGEDRAQAAAGETVTLRLEAPVGTAAGDVLAAAGDRPETCDQFAADLLWIGPEPLLPGRAYRIEIGTRQVPGSVTRIKHRIAGDDAPPVAAGTLRVGDRGRVNLSLAQPVAFEPFARDRALGTFTVVDTASGHAMGVGTIDFALRRAANIHRQAVDVTKAARAAAKAQRPALLWFTGLSGAGKSTIANLVEKRLFALGHHTYLLDGDNVRHGLNRDLGFTAADRVENIRRVAETAKLMVDAGLITLASFISPFRAERQLARDLLTEGEFVEVFVDAPLGVVEARDPKGLYAQARAGRIPNFTGIDSPYEPPAAPELHLETHRRSADELADEVVAYLDRAGFLDAGAD